MRRGVGEGGRWREGEYDALHATDENLHPPNPFGTKVIAGSLE